jgi:hypothetical protein
MPGCKPGDIAKFVPEAKNAGKLVLVGELYAPGIFFIKPLEPLFYRARRGASVWHGPTMNLSTGACEDRFLIPIRPGDLDAADPRDLKAPSPIDDDLLEAMKPHAVDHA